MRTTEKLLMAVGGAGLVLCAACSHQGPSHPPAKAGPARPEKMAQPAPSTPKTGKPAPSVAQPSSAAPAAKGALTAAQSKEKRLADLLELYKADKITPHEYHQQRAKILAEP
ncbi:MAG: hypothetical protein M1608_00025 [Candidatus Omnitrophica bacterium]|nr:hypothetical protein [Candidatus Omnitrophota bacterium]